MHNGVIITSEGYEKLTRELEILRREKRPAAIERLKKAREMGDLSENSEYVAAKEGLSFVDARILQIEEMLKNAEITEKSADRSTVKIGDEVVIAIDNETKTFRIVGEHEADIQTGKLSHKSPIGMALLGKRKGDMIKVRVPAGQVQYKILDIR